MSDDIYEEGESSKSTDLHCVARFVLGHQIGTDDELAFAIITAFDAKRARVAELEVERAAIVAACGFDHDHDPEAPKTLSEYVRETQIMAVRCATEWTSDYKEAAVRRLSRHSKHIGEENERLRARVEVLDAKVADAVACFEIECPCCGQVAASWYVIDGDDLECGCDGQISCCSETYPYASADDCGCGGNGYPKPDPTREGGS